MSHYDKTKYWWIKLSKNFMTSDTVDFLMTQKNGADYVVLYQMLCLKTMNENGTLVRQIGEMIVPFDEEKIQRDCKWFSIDTVRVAMVLYQKLGLIYKQEDGILRIADYENIVGYTTEGAEKKKKQRKLSKGGQSSGQKADICPPYISLISNSNNINSSYLNSLEENNTSNSLVKGKDYKGNQLGKKEKEEKETFLVGDMTFENVIDLNFQDKELKKELLYYVEMRLSQSKGFTPRGLDALCKKLQRMSTDVQEQIDIVINSTVKCYKSFFKEDIVDSKTNHEECQTELQKAREFEEWYLSRKGENNDD